MNVEPIIKVRFNKFREMYDLLDLKEGLAFERFVNHSILSNHQPDAFGADTELLDMVCVGGYDDKGIDGIGIKVNGFLVNNIDEAKDIIEKFRRVTVEFIFIQSKMSSSFDSGEFVKFTSGVRDFLSDKQVQPSNAKIKLMLNIKDHLLSDEVIYMWDKNPSVRCYYVAMGKWQDSIHLKAHEEQFLSDIEILSAYGEANVHFVDADTLKVICDNNENTFNVTIETIDTMALTDVHGVNNSCVVLCYSSEFMKLLSTEEGVIRKSLFEDNVRDFQGSNNVNDEISKTIESEPEKFALLNNGVTIVCDEYVQSNRRITLKNPQIVNGCQTSHVLFFSNKKGFDLSSAPLHLKVISTSDLDITNQIVRGTNRQNIVYDEAFEATKIFHKELEDFFNAIGGDYERIYYERRSKQFQHNPKIKPLEKISLKVLTQYSISVLLNTPHMSHRHEAKLIEDFSNKIFLRHQSKLPYYAVSLLYSRAEKFFRSSSIKEKNLHAYRPHILMVSRELACGNLPSLNKEKQIDNYFKDFLAHVCDDQKLSTLLNRAIEIFEKATAFWIKDLKRSSDGRKDIEEFTKVLLTYCNEITNKQGTQGAIEEHDDVDALFGEVVNIIRDRNGLDCGFISGRNDDVFFHSKSNPGLDFSMLLGTMVSYEVDKNPKNGKLVAKNVKSIDIA